jgi:multiple sugar transport system permease protein
VKRKEALAQGALLMAAVLFVLPLAATFIGSLMTGQEIALNYSSRLTFFDAADGIVKKCMKLILIPQKVYAGQYADVLVNQSSFLLLLVNSLKIAVPVTLGSLAVSTLTAYGFTVSAWKYKEALFAVYVTVMLMPLQAVLVPNYLTAQALGLEHSYLAIILPGIFSPFGVFLIRQSMRAFPKAYFEAAQIDGASHWAVLWYILLPQLNSARAALCMLTFIEYWNVVEQAVIFIDDYTREPLSVYLSRLADKQSGLIFAASCVYMAPPLWFLFANQRDLEKGIELSGIK